MTPHAVARYRAQVARGATYEAALGALVRAGASAHRVCRRTRDGVEAELWRAARAHGRLRLVVLPPARPGDLPALVTVQAEHDARLPGGARRGAR